jgi:hypothetical protein
MRVLVAIFISYVSCVLVNNMTESSGWFEKHDGNWVCKWLYNGFDEILGVLLSTPPSGPMKSVGSSHGSLSLQFWWWCNPCWVFVQSLSILHTWVSFLGSRVQFIPCVAKREPKLSNGLASCTTMIPGNS